MTNNEPKDLITDILTCLAENDEVRNRFSTIYGIQTELDVNTGEVAFCTWGNFCTFNRNESYYEKLGLLQHFLSSPQGKPLLPFLDVENPNHKTVRLSLKNPNNFDNKEARHRWEMNLRDIPPTISHVLFNLLSDCINNGESWERTVEVLNEKYNELM